MAAGMSDHDWSWLDGFSERAGASARNVLWLLNFLLSVTSRWAAQSGGSSTWPRKRESHDLYQLSAPLLVAQGVERIDARGAVRGHKTCEQSRGGQERGDRHKRKWIGRPHRKQHGLNETRQ